MKKVFLVVLNYEEETSDLFSDVGVECTFDNQLFELKQNGHISSYDDTVAFDVSEVDSETIEKFVNIETRQ